MCFTDLWYEWHSAYAYGTLRYASGYTRLENLHRVYIKAVREF